MSHALQLLNIPRGDALRGELCGRESRGELLHELRLSRAFAEFAASELSRSMYAVPIGPTRRERIVGHISRDADGNRRLRKTRHTLAAPAITPLPFPTL
jgi:hypothetical protein